MHSDESGTSNKVRIIDATLREGMQAHGVGFSVKGAVEITNCLVGLGVDMIECGHPAVGDKHLELIKAVVAAANNTPVLAHSRAKIVDVEKVRDSGAKWVGIFAGVNDFSNSARIRSDQPLAETISESVSFAKSQDLLVRFTIEDATRTPLDLLERLFGVAIDAGADRLCIADSVGCFCPWEFEELVEGILNVTGKQIDIEVHCHDDRGLSLANVLSAVRKGAKWISSSVNGIGERCGITDTLALMINLYDLGYRQKVNGNLLQYTSTLVQSLSRCSVDRQRPVTGSNATIHVAKLHKKAVCANPDAYAWLKPELFGKRNMIDLPTVPDSLGKLINSPVVIGSSELKYHRDGIGERYLMIDDRVVPDCRQYCIVRNIPEVASTPPAHVDEHRHVCDSLFLFVGNGKGLEGLKVEVSLGEEVFNLESPSSVFIPAGFFHSYRIISGSGLFINHVLRGNYNESLLEKFDFNMLHSNSLVESFIRENCPGVQFADSDELSNIFDSLTFLNFFVYAEKHFGEKVSLDEVASCKTVGDLYRYISQL